MKHWWVVAKKEIVDNFRDKRSFFFAIVYGPIILPLFLVGPMLLGAKSGFINFEKDTNIYVVGSEYAPNLITHLASKNLLAVEAPDDFKDQVREGELDAVLEIPKSYGETLRTGKPSPLYLYVNLSSKNSNKVARHIKSVISGYSHGLGYWRMRARGFDYQITQAVQIVEQDLSHEGIGGMVFGALTYFVLVFTMIMGGFYLAVDITAGERERNSIEPLLALPISRFDIVFGKYVATLIYVSLSGVLSVITLYLLFNIVPLGEIGDILNLNAKALIQAFLVTLPCAICLSGLLMAAAAFTRSPKEAQTYLGLLSIMPLIPMGVGQFANIKIQVVNMLIPFFSQYTLIDKIFKNETIASEFVYASIFGTLLAALVFFRGAVFLYRREKILL